MTRIFLTTSWDDGSAYDARLADLLDRVGVRGTFYVPGHAAGAPRTDGAHLRDLVARGHEIGSHTRTHVRLHRLPLADAQHEIETGRADLEQILGTAIGSFAYPGGECAGQAVAAVRAAGVRLARTTAPMHNRVPTDVLRVPVTAQIFPHSRSMLMRTTLKRSGPGRLWWLLRHAGGWQRLAAAALADCQMRGHGVVHLWGHSHELDDLDLWQPLELCLRELRSAPGIVPVTNADVVG